MRCCGIARGRQRSSRRGARQQTALNLFSRALLCYSFPLLFLQLIHALSFFCASCFMSLGCWWTTQCHSLHSCRSLSRRLFPRLRKQSHRASLNAACLRGYANNNGWSMTIDSIQDVLARHLHFVRPWMPGTSRKKQMEEALI